MGSPPITALVKVDFPPQTWSRATIGTKVSAVGVASDNYTQLFHRAGATTPSKFVDVYAAKGGVHL